MSEADDPAQPMARAVADLWSQVIETGADFVIFHDHFGNPVRVRYQPDGYALAPGRDFPYVSLKVWPTRNATSRGEY